MKIFHGTHEVHLHQQLQLDLEQAQKNNQEIFRLSAKNITLADLELALGEQDLFQNKKLVVLEHLHSLPKSARKQTLLTYLQTEQDNENVLLLEKKDLTTTQLKKFPQAKAQHFPTSSTLFKWLDCLGNKRVEKQALTYLAKAKESDGAGFCFAMLARQTRLLLQAKDGGELTGPPFVQTKLRNQAKQFSLPELLRLHQKLLENDYKNKTSGSPFSLEQQLDLLTLSL